MGMKLITGKAETAHVSSADDGALNAGIVGSGRYVLPVGKQFEYELLSNNSIKVCDGYGINQGRLIGIKSGEYEELVIENGIAGTKRSDLVVARYELDTNTGIEKCTLRVIKGTSGDAPVDPDVEIGNILEGANVDDFPLYRVNIDGLNVSSVDQLFKTIYSIEDDTGWTSEGITVEGVISNSLQYRKIGNKVYWRGFIAQSVRSSTIKIPESITPKSSRIMTDIRAYNSDKYNYALVFTFNVSSDSLITVNVESIGTVGSGSMSTAFNGSYLLD